MMKAQKDWIVFYYCFSIARWLKHPQDSYQQSLEQGFNIEFPQAVPAKRPLEDNNEADTPKIPKTSQTSKVTGKPKSASDTGTDQDSRYFAILMNTPVWNNPFISIYFPSG